MKLTISVQDVAKMQLVEPGWRKAKVKSVEREQNAARTGMNTIVKFEIDNGVLPNGIPDLREITQWFPDSYIANWIPLLEAVYDKKFTLETMNEGFDFDPSTLLDVVIWADVTRTAILQDKKDTGRMRNEIKGYQALNNPPF